MKYLISAFLLRSFFTYEKWRNHLMDRLYANYWPRKFAECGRDVHIYSPCVITGPQYVHLGSNVHINRGAFIRAEGGLAIGDNVHIARNLVIYTINHNYAGNAIPYDQTLIKKPVVIQKNVWIGINVIIVPGVTIGEGAVIGAGSVVTSDVPPLACVGSSSLRIIKYRDREHYVKLHEAKIYGGVNGFLYRKWE